MSGKGGLFTAERGEAINHFHDHFKIFLKISFPLKPAH